MRHIDVYNNVESIYIPKQKMLNFIIKALSADIELGGVMIGRMEDFSVKVGNIIIGENIYNSPNRFMLDTDLIAKAIRDLDEDRDIVGIIHSHPAPPIPSSIDIENMRLWPVIWTIVSSITGEYKVWRPNRKEIINIILY